MAVGRVVFGRVQKLLELLIGDGCAVHIKAGDVHALAMKTPRRVFPGILHVHSGIVAAFDFNSLHCEIVVGLGNSQHSWRRRGGDFG